MSDILTYPVPYTMAFGGVATGSMKTREVDTAAAIMRLSGSRPIAMPTAQMTGMSMVVVAVFEVISERNLAKNTITVRIRMTGIDLSSIRLTATNRAAPVS